VAVLTQLWFQAHKAKRDQKMWEAVEKVGLGADLFAVTIPCCANQRGRR